MREYITKVDDIEKYKKVKVEEELLAESAPQPLMMGNDQLMLTAPGFGMPQGGMPGGYGAAQMGYGAGVPGMSGVLTYHLFLSSWEVYIWVLLTIIVHFVDL